MKKKTLTSRFFKATVFIMVAVFTTLAFAGCEKEERSSVESSETTSVAESTIQEESVQKSETQEISIPESTIQEASTQKSIIEVSLEKIEDSSDGTSEEESQSSEEEKYTFEEIKEILPIYSFEDWEILQNIEEKDIIVYARFIDKSNSFKLKEGDIVGIIGKDEYDELVFWFAGKGQTAAIDMNYFEYLKDYVPKSGEVVGIS